MINYLLSLQSISFAFKTAAFLNHFMFANENSRKRLCTRDDASGLNITVTMSAQFSQAILIQN